MSALKSVVSLNDQNADRDLQQAGAQYDAGQRETVPVAERIADNHHAHAANDQTQHELPAKPQKSFAKRVVLPVVLLAVLCAALWYGYNWWTTGRFMVSTDDAYINGDIMAVSPKVSGYIEQVPVTANQRVNAGDVIYQLDQGDYLIALNEAKAKLETQITTLARIDAQRIAAEAAMQQAEAAGQSSNAVLINAQATMQRMTKLHETRFLSQSDLDSATMALAQARAGMANAEAQIATAAANIGVLKAQYQETASQTRSLELSRDKAERDLSFTTLRAPYDGVVGNMTAKQGDLVSAGQRIAALVPVDGLYIDANFKETQLKSLHGGETVYFTVDALQGERFEGKLVSLSPASGSVFSLLPAENATGNFTKVVQRVPVRIAIPADALATGKLRAGLSVVVDVDTRTSAKQAQTEITPKQAQASSKAAE